MLIVTGAARQRVPPTLTLSNMTHLLLTKARRSPLRRPGLLLSSRAASRLVLLVLCAGGALASVACDRVAGDSDREKAIASEQQAIAAYSAKVPEAEQFQSKFVDAWKKVNEIKDLKAFKEGVEAQVIPALDQYLAALTMMPTSSKPLEAVHAEVVKSYKTAVGAFRVFVSGLTDENVESRYRELLGQMDTVVRAEKQYRKALAVYYAENRVKLVGAEAK